MTVSQMTCQFGVDPKGRVCLVSEGGRVSSLDVRGRW